MSEPGFPDQPDPAAGRHPDRAPDRAPGPDAADAGDWSWAGSPDPAEEPTTAQTVEADQDSTAHRARLRFRRWRRTRPFWGGFLVALGGIEIAVTEKAPFAVVVHVGLYGLAGYLLPLILVLCGILLLFNPQQRMFYSILSVLLSLGTWLTSNLGGFFVGMLLGIIGGSLAFGWAPGGERPTRRQRAALKERARREQPVVGNSMHGDLAP